MSRSQNITHRFLITVYCLLITLLTACQPPAAPPTSPFPLSTPSPLPTSNLSLSTPTSTPTEAPLTLAELGIQDEGIQSFRGVEGHIKREFIDGEKVYTTTTLYHNGEKKEIKYIIEPGTFDAHTEIHDDLTRPLAVKAYRLDENGEKTEVILFWQGPERGFREAIDLSGAYDPELNQVYKHPYLHIVHGDRPIQSIKDLPKDDERLTLLQSVRYEQAKAIRALQDVREKLQNGEEITAQDLQGSVFLRPLQEKLEAGERITEDDLYVLFSPKAVEKWDAGGGLSLLFELQEDGSKWVRLKSKGNDQIAYAEKHTEDDYDSLNMKFVPLWFYTKDENGNVRHKMLIVILDADDVQRYKVSQNPLKLQGKLIIGENEKNIKVSSENNTYWIDLYRAKKPDFPTVILYAEGGDYFTKTDEELIQDMTKKGIAPETQEKILSERSRLAHLLSLPDNKAGETWFLKPAMVYVDELNPNDPLIETQPYANPLDPTLQLLELMFDVRISN